MACGVPGVEADEGGIEIGEVEELLEESEAGTETASLDLTSLRSREEVRAAAVSTEEEEGVVGPGEDRSTSFKSGVAVEFDVSTTGRVDAGVQGGAGGRVGWGEDGGDEVDI